MNAVLRSMFLLPALLLVSCGGGGHASDQARQREEARIQREVDQRVAKIRTEMKVSEKRWHTAKIVALCALAGGVLLWLMPHKGGANQPNVPELNTRIPHARTRVIERQDAYEDDSHRR